MKFTNEQVEKAKKCQTVDELINLAKTDGLELSKEDAEKCFKATRVGKLSDDDLDVVAGGKGESEPVWENSGYYLMEFICPFCGATVHYREDFYTSGDMITTSASVTHCTCGAEVHGYNGSKTATCTKDGATRHAQVISLENHI